MSGQKKSAVCASALLVAMLSLGPATGHDLTPPAWAHDSVIGGNIESGEVIQEMPEKLVLEFSGQPKEGFNSMALTRDGGEVVFSGEPRVEDRNISIDVPADVELSPGEYLIGYQITSSDGHATRGGISFELAGSGVQEHSAEAPHSTTDGAADDSAEPAGALEDLGPFKWLIALGAILAIGAVGVVLLAKRSMVDDITDKNRATEHPENL